MTDLLSNFTSLSKKQLAELDGTCGWSLSALELAEVQRQFRGMGRQPSRGELETIAQTWSEHCKHKTFSGPVAFRAGGRVKKYKNLFKETIVRATRKLNKKWCLSVFTDNAGIVQFGKSGKWDWLSRPKPITIPVRSSLTAAPRPGLAGLSAISWAWAWALSLCLIPTVFVSATPTVKRSCPEIRIRPSAS